jgi:type I restriction enzyme M protein
MTEQSQKKLGNTLWAIADQLRGAMDADDFRDYMLSFLFLRYLSDNYEVAAKKELGSDYPHQAAQRRAHRHSDWPAVEPVFFHRHSGVHLGAQEVQKAGRCAVHQRGRPF